MPLRITKAEWALLAGMLLLPATLVVGVRLLLEQRRLQAVVQEDMQAIEEAILAFYDEYGIWPSVRTGHRGDARYGREIPNAHVFNVLRAVDGPGNPQHQLNPHRMVFIEPRRAAGAVSGLDETGNFLDPWGHAYQIVMDTDLDGHCDIERSTYGHLRDIQVAVWSCGPDGLSDTADDILSWAPR